MHVPLFSTDYGWDDRFEEETLDVVSKVCEERENGARNVTEEGTKMHDIGGDVGKKEEVDVVKHDV